MSSNYFYVIFFISKLVNYIKKIIGTYMAIVYTYLVNIVIMNNNAWNT